jgi:hypothetical protein
VARVGEQKATKRGQLAFVAEFFMGTLDAAVATAVLDFRESIIQAGLRVRRSAEQQKHADSDVTEGVAVVAGLLRGVESVLYIFTEFRRMRSSAPEFTSWLEHRRDRLDALFPAVIQWIERTAVAHGVELALPADVVNATSRDVSEQQSTGRRTAQPVTDGATPDSPAGVAANQTTQ